MGLLSTLLGGAKTKVVLAPFLIVGLGNPGAQYEETRHNIGFMVVDEISQSRGLSLKFSPFKQAFKGLVAEATWKGQKILLLKPQTFMNLSGESVAACARFYKIPIEHILVIHDELDLILADIRLKQGGGDGGHNGLKSITQHLGNMYSRLRVGIGHPGQKDKVTPYVLGSFSKDERPVVHAICDSILKNLPLFLEEKKDVFMRVLQESLKSYRH